LGSDGSDESVTHTGDINQCEQCGSNLKSMRRSVSFKNIFLTLLSIVILIDSWRIAVVVFAFIFGMKYFSKFLYWIGID
jgi:hypothetical protein